MQAGVSREECCPPLAIASLRTRGPPPPLAGGLGPFPSGSLHGSLPQVGTILPQVVLTSCRALGYDE